MVYRIAYTKTTAVYKSIAKAKILVEKAKATIYCIIAYTSLMGRPSTYHPSTVEVICDRLSKGEPLAKICRDDSMPGHRTVYDWMEKQPEVSAIIARARDLGEDVIASDLREVARGGAGSSGDVQRDKLIVETDLKLLAKWNPKKYGDRIENRLAGPEGEALKIIVTGIRPTEDNT